MHGGRWFQGTPVIVPYDLWENSSNEEMGAESKKHSNTLYPIYSESAFKPLNTNVRGTTANRGCALVRHVGSSVTPPPDTGILGVLFTMVLDPRDAPPSIP